PGAAAISRTRVATCAAKAPTKANTSSHSKSVDIRKKRLTQGPTAIGRHGRLPLQGCSEGGNNFEQVADNRVVGHFENWRVGIFVDRNDGVRSFPADQMLDGAGDTEREIQLRRDGLARAPHLSLHR